MFFFSISTGSRDSDYEPFVAHSDNSNDGCLLGVKETFERLRKDSWYVAFHCMYKNSVHNAS